MKITLLDLKEYSRMSDTERKAERGRAIRQEINERMRWMPKRWRQIVRCRYIMGMSILRTATELNICESTVTRATSEIARWLKDTDAYLDEQV